MFIKVVLEKFQGEGVSDKRGRITELVVPHETYLYQTEQVVWEKCPAGAHVPKVGSEWSTVMMCPDNDPVATEFLSVRMEDHKLQIVAYGATLHVMNDQGKTIDVVRTATTTG